ncbi:MAG: HU family DNA-binding protein [Elusimicrobia bacterium]|nr:HU family DNA-binding protein [Elusimicrobiota bacterium]
MKKQDLLEFVYEKSKVKPAVAKKVIQSLIRAIAESVQNGDKVTLTGLGTFRIKVRKAKVARNMQTGEAVRLPEGKKISFKPSLSFKQILKI